MKANDEKKAAIKLINQYAEQYNRKETENKMLQVEIEDLKKNIRINKEIIDGFFNPEQKEKSKLFLRKTKEEIALLNQTNANLRNEIKQFKEKIAYYEILLNESILKYNNSTDALQLKIFSLENLIKKKDAIIYYLNIKLSALYDSRYTGEECERELNVLEPQTALLLINSELEKEKEMNDLLNHKNNKFKNQIEILQKEIKDNDNKEKEDNESSYDDSQSRSTIVKDIHKGNHNATDSNNNKTNGNPIGTLESIAKSVDENKPNWEKKEWIEILRSVHMTPESLYSMSKIEMYKNITEVIEMLIKTIMERNMQLRVLLKTNTELNNKNSSLSNNVASLKQDILGLKNEVKSLNKLRSCNISLIQHEKKTLEMSLLKERKNQCKNYEQYLEEFNAKSIRINESIADEAIKECCKSFMSLELAENKKGDINANMHMHMHGNKNESIVSEGLFADPINGGNNDNDNKNILLNE